MSVVAYDAERKKDFLTSLRKVIFTVVTHAWVGATAYFHTFQPNTKHDMMFELSRLYAYAYAAAMIFGTVLGSIVLLCVAFKAKEFKFEFNNDDMVHIARRARRSLGTSLMSGAALIMPLLFYFSGFHVSALIICGTTICAIAIGWYGLPAALAKAEVKLSA